MPERNYMQIDGRRDHSFRVPRPDLSEKIGVPNACTQSCHQDRDDAWALTNWKRWNPKRTGDHFGEAFAKAWEGEDVSVWLAAIATDDDNPAVVRATAIELLRGHRSKCVQVALYALEDPEPLVREVSYGCGEGFAPDDRVSWAAPGLTDESRLVRLEAARLLAGLDARMAPSQRVAYRKARAELVARHRAESDVPDGSFNLGVLAEAEGDPDSARTYYRAALKIDAAYVPAAVNLAGLHLRSGKCVDAMRVLRVTAKHVPNNPVVRRAIEIVYKDKCQSSYK